MALQDKRFNKSPVAQDFIWVADYADGTHLAEFDFDTKEENSFYSIDKNKLFRFGLIGHGQSIYFERDGVLNVAGRRIQVFYRHNGNLLPLNGDFKYNTNDIITYKDAESVGLMAGYKGRGQLSSSITQYNVGYKTDLHVGGINFHFKPIVHLPLNQPAYISFWLVPDVELDGEFVIVSNGKTVEDIKAPLGLNEGGAFNWKIQ